MAKTEREVTIELVENLMWREVSSESEETTVPAAICFVAQASAALIAHLSKNPEYIKTNEYEMRTVLTPKGIDYVHGLMLGESPEDLPIEYFSVIKIVWERMERHLSDTEK